MRDQALRRTLGFLLIAVSAAAVVQSVRELLLWEMGQRRYDDREVLLEIPFRFAGHTFTVADDQPVDSVPSEAESEGTLQLLMDGQPIGPPSRARIRRGRRDLGRYHLWVDAWPITDRRTGRTTLWFVRRLEAVGARSPRFEVNAIDEDGTRQTRILRTRELGSNYPLFRSTQFVRDGTSSAVPLSMLDALIFPPILLVFPIGTLVLGIYLVRRHPAARSTA